MGWDLKSDRFEIGQWFPGRIYERRCDLSPDGKYLIYFAMNGRWREKSRGAWTAISRAPYLKALEFWPWGDCYDGGGLFEDNDRVWVNGSPGPTRHAARPPADLKNSPSFKITRGSELSGAYGDGTVDVYHCRLQRDGWELVAETRGIAVFCKQADHGWRIKKCDKQRRGNDLGKAISYDSH